MPRKTIPTRVRRVFQHGPALICLSVPVTFIRGLPNSATLQLKLWFRPEVPKWQADRLPILESPKRQEEGRLETQILRRSSI